MEEREVLNAYKIFSQEYIYNFYKKVYSFELKIFNWAEWQKLIFKFSIPKRPVYVNYKNWGKPMVLQFSIQISAVAALLPAAETPC